MISSRPPMSAPAGLVTTVVADQPQRHPRPAVDDPDAAPGQAGIDPEHPHAATT